MPVHAGHGRKIKALTTSEIQKLTTAYVRNLSIAATARETGFSFPTVRKYVEDGDAKRGIPSIKSTLAQRVKQTNFAQSVPPQHVVEYSVGEAFDNSTRIFRILKGLFQSKFAGLLKDLDSAIKSGDQTKIAAAQSAVFPQLKVEQVPRLLLAEALVFEKMGPKEQGGGANHAEPPPEDVEEEIRDFMDVLADHGLVVDDDEPRKRKPRNQSSAIEDEIVEDLDLEEDLES